MKTDFLKKLGIEDQSIIDQILAENGRDIKREQDKAETFKTKVATLESDLEKQKDDLAELDKFKTAASKVDDLKEKIKQLEADAETAKTKYDSDIKGVKKNYLVEAGLKNRGAKNTKMVKALLDMDKIDIDDEGKLTGFDEQIDSIVGDENYKFAFGSEDKSFKGLSPTNASGSNGGDSTPKTFAQIISAQLNKS